MKAIKERGQEGGEGPRQKLIKGTEGREKGSPGREE